MSLNTIEQRRALMAELNAVDLQRAQAFQALVKSPEATGLLDGLKALHDPTEAPPPNGAMTVNVAIGYLVTTLGNAPEHADKLVEVLTPPEPVEEEQPDGEG